MVDSQPTNAATVSALDLVLGDVRFAGDYGRTMALEPHQARIIMREIDRLRAELSTRRPNQYVMNRRAER